MKTFMIALLVIAAIDAALLSLTCIMRNEYLVALLFGSFVYLLVDAICGTRKENI